MQVTRAIAIAGLCLSLMGGCAAGEPSTRSAPYTPYTPKTYVVQPQDTLYSIAWRHDIDYRDLAKWNNIGPDYRLTVGQVLSLQPDGRAAPAPPRTAAVPPVPPMPATPAAAPARPVPSGTPPGSVRGVAPGSPAGVARVGKPTPLPDPGAPGAGAAGGAAAGAPGVGAAGGAAAGAGGGSTGDGARAGASTWVWPTDRMSAPRPVPGGGLLLLGRVGQDVRAAGAGRVVYTGSGIRGYGNLIIIKHGESLLSSYAHNREMLVHEGQDVLAGQVIGHMGTGSHQTAVLYFEIRVNGKPVDPLRFLPAVIGAAVPPPGAVPPPAH